MQELIHRSHVGTDHRELIDEMQRDLVVMFSALEQKRTQGVQRFRDQIILQGADRRLRLELKCGDDFFFLDRQRSPHHRENGLVLGVVGQYHATHIDGSDAPGTMEGCLMERAGRLEQQLD